MFEESVALSVESVNGTVYKSKALRKQFNLICTPVSRTPANYHLL